MKFNIALFAVYVILTESSSKQLSAVCKFQNMCSPLCLTLLFVKLAKMLLVCNMAGMPLQIQPIYLRNCFPKGGKLLQKEL